VRAAADFLPFVLGHLPPSPARVLEVGCGEEGGLVEDLASRGYHIVGVDPRAPDGNRYLRSEFQEVADVLAAERWDAVIAARVLIMWNRSTTESRCLRGSRRFCSSMSSRPI